MPRAPKTDKLRPHRKHLKEPPDDYLKERLPKLGLKREEVDALPSLVVSGQKDEVVVNPKGVKPKLVDAAKHTHKLKLKTLDELKEVAGVPSRLLEDPEVRQRVPDRIGDPGRLSRLPKRLQVNKLDPDSTHAVFDVASSLLYGYVDDEVLERPGYKAVAKLMLELAKDMPIFFGPNLVVADGQKVAFSNYGVLYFHNIVIVGSGQIVPGNGTTVHAYSIARV